MTGDVLVFVPSSQQMLQLCFSTSDRIAFSMILQCSLWLATFCSLLSPQTSRNLSLFKPLGSPLDLPQTDPREILLLNSLWFIRNTLVIECRHNFPMLFFFPTLPENGNPIYNFHTKTSPVRSQIVSQCLLNFRKHIASCQVMS